VIVHSKLKIIFNKIAILTLFVIIFCIIKQESHNPIVFPSKGVKGKGAVTIVEDPTTIVAEREKISMKYLGTLDHQIAKMVTESSKKGENVLIEISPKFYSTWDYGKE